MRTRKELPAPRFCLLPSKSLETLPLLLLSPSLGHPILPMVYPVLPVPLSTTFLNKQACRQ